MTAPKPLFTTFPLDTTANGGKPLVRFSLIHPGQHVHSATGRYGVRTGKDVGFFVIDVDVKNGKRGYEGLALACAGRPLPPTLTVPTPSGGLHIYYAIPDGLPVPNSQSRLADGVDVRGEGGYVVAAGTTHKNGGTYGPAQGEMAVAPEWLLALVRPERQGQLVTVDGLPMSPDEIKAREALFRADCETWPPAVEGQGGSDVTWHLAIRGAKHYGLPQSGVARVLWETYNRRCLPPWSADEIAHKAGDAARAEVPIGTYVDVEALLPEWQRVAELPVPTPAMVDRPDSPNVATVDSPHVYTFDATSVNIVAKTRQTNILEAVQVLTRSPQWVGVWQWDTFTGKILAVRPPLRLDCERGELTEVDVHGVCCWFYSQGLAISPKLCDAAIKLAASMARVDTLRAYVDSLEPMGLEEARTLLSQLAHIGFGSTSPGCEVFVRRTMVGAIQRALFPGWQHDTVLSLIGPQGYRKTTAIAALFEARWFRAQMPSLAERDGSHALVGYWGVNFDEMKVLLSKDPLSTKEYLTRPQDIYRQFGNGETVTYWRRCVFFATANKEEALLRDPTGERRYLIMTVSRVCSPEWIRDHRHGLWRAAKALATAGELNYLTPEEKAAYLSDAQADYLEVDGWQDRVLEWADAQPKPFTLTQCYLGLFGGFDHAQALERFDNAKRRKIAAILRRNGWDSKTVREGARTSSMWAKG